MNPSHHGGADPDVSGRAGAKLLVDDPVERFSCPKGQPVALLKSLRRGPGEEYELQARKRPISVEAIFLTLLRDWGP